eukprot:CAMPEP_0202725338 /NCGR_PEP_ID=MMETSP1385-20130828/181166_1 /ASSEMBLY_ACC=CAM_ASM_000861 /TAXON_ID=933848 /ORGANISM="Elphidium margaritaceum" /LENGTH=274 /DNA_ID=CAMNT_0049391351 /DNA_START=128 /DNA_END=949 /DNA_ORIENTATION=-
MRHASYAHASFANVDLSLHTEDEKALLDKWAQQSIEEGCVVLHVPPKGAWKHGNSSPSCAKLQAYLNYNKISYIEDSSLQLLPLPIHKVPWITYNGIHTADSQVIVERLNHELNIDNDQHLNAQQRRLSHAYRAVLDQFYWNEVFRRYKSDEGRLKYFQRVFVHFGDEVAKQAESQFGPLLSEQLYQQGTGRYDGDTLYASHIAYMDNILGAIGESTFFHGEKISTIDFAIYGFFSSMCGIADSPFPDTKRYDGKLHRMDEALKYVERAEKKIL